MRHLFTQKTRTKFSQQSRKCKYGVDNTFLYYNCVYFSCFAALVLFSFQIFALDCTQALTNLMSASDQKLNVRYYTRTEQLAHLILVSDEGLLLSNGEKLSTGARGLIYVVTLEGELIASVNLTKIIHHTTLAMGQPILAAGWFAVQHGRIQTLSNESGHYKPTKNHLQFMINYLVSKGVSLRGAFIGDFSSASGGTFFTFH